VIKSCVFGQIVFLRIDCEYMTQSNFKN